MVSLPGMLSELNDSYPFSHSLVANIKPSKDQEGPMQWLYSSYLEHPKPVFQGAHLTYLLGNELSSLFVKGIRLRLSCVTGGNPLLDSAMVPGVLARKSCLHFQ